MQSLNPDPKAHYTSVYGALKKIIRTEGFWRPLRGLNVMMMGAGPAHAMYFACYENMKRTLNAVFHHQGNSHLANGICKRLSGVRKVSPSTDPSPGFSSLWPSCLTPHLRHACLRTKDLCVCTHTQTYAHTPTQTHTHARALFFFFPLLRFLKPGENQWQRCFIVEWVLPFCFFFFNIQKQLMIRSRGKKKHPE